jgi:hypothetical protein
MLVLGLVCVVRRMSSGARNEHRRRVAWLYLVGRKFVLLFELPWWLGEPALGFARFFLSCVASPLDRVTVSVCPIVCPLPSDHMIPRRL